MKLLFIGDVVGSIGRNTLYTYLPKLKQLYKPQLTIVNGENAASGRGITEKIYKEFLQAGVDVVTMGNHTWDNKDIFNFIDHAKKLVRPANYPPKTAGVGSVLVNVNGTKVAIINIHGRVFMNALEDPFRVVDELVEQYQKETNHIFVDFHAETTSEKQAMGWFLDGRVSAVVGTHTHVQTRDARILPKGTAYLTDVGMTGPYDSVLGMKKEAVLQKFLTQMPTRFEVVEEGDAVLSACVITLDPQTGRATKIEPILINRDSPLR